MKLLDVILRNRFIVIVHRSRKILCYPNQVETYIARKKRDDVDEYIENRR